MTCTLTTILHGNSVTFSVTTDLVGDVLYQLQGSITADFGQFQIVMPNQAENVFSFIPQDHLFYRAVVIVGNETCTTNVIESTVVNINAALKTDAASACSAIQACLNAGSPTSISGFSHNDGARTAFSITSSGTTTNYVVGQPTTGSVIYPSYLYTLNSSGAVTYRAQIKTFLSNTPHPLGNVYSVFSVNNIAYVLDAQKNLFNLNLKTGEVIFIGNTGIQSNSFFAFSDGTKAYIIDDAEYLYTLDVSTGVATKVGNEQIDLPFFALGNPQCAFFYGSTCFLIDRANRLYILDTTTAKATSVNPITKTPDGNTFQPIPGFPYYKKAAILAVFSDLSASYMIDSANNLYPLNIACCNGSNQTCDTFNTGTCQCNTGFTDCNGACVDKTSDIRNCGSCSKACTTSVANADPVCLSGKCSYVCKAGYIDCGGNCVAAQSATDNCGACGNKCAAGQTCTEGICSCSQASDCGPGLQCLSGQCQPIFPISQCPSPSASCPTLGSSVTPPLNLASGVTFAAMLAGTLIVVVDSTGTISTFDTAVSPSPSNWTTFTAIDGATNTTITGTTAGVYNPMGYIDIIASTANGNYYCYTSLENIKAKNGAFVTTKLGAWNTSVSATANVNSLFLYGNTFYVLLSDGNFLDLFRNSKIAGPITNNFGPGALFVIGKTLYIYEALSDGTHPDLRYLYSSTNALTWTNNGAVKNFTTIEHVIVYGGAAYAYDTSSSTFKSLTATCANISTDTNNCGTCGAVCGGATPDCCAGSCINKKTNSNNCGACGTKCLVSQTCSSGKCTCKTSLTLTYSNTQGTAGINFNSGAPTVSGFSGALTYSITPALSTGTGLSFSVTSGTLSGMPVAADVNTYTITVTDGACMATATIKICNVITLSYATPVTGVAGTDFSSALPTIAGSNNPSYTIAAVPASATLDSHIKIDSMGIIKVSAGILVGTYHISVTVTDTVTKCVSSFPVTITVTCPTNLSLAYSNIPSITAGTSAASLVPTPSGFSTGATLTYSITGVSGVSISTDGTIITAHSNATAGLQTATITVKDTGSKDVTSSCTASVSVSFNICPVNLSLAYPTIPGTFGKAFTLAPTLFGLTNPTYSISGTFDPGITMDTSSGKISVAATVPIGVYNATVTATNSICTAKANVVIVVNSSSCPATLSYDLNTLIPVTSGLTNPTYQLVIASGTTPNGITINKSSGIISISSQTALGIYNIIVIATSGDCSATTTLVGVINDTGSSAKITNSSVVPITSGTSTMAQAPKPPVGFPTPIFYALQGAVPDGVSIDSNTGVITIPASLPPGVYNIIITTTGGDPTTIISSVTVVSSPSSCSSTLSYVAVGTADASGSATFSPTVSGFTPTSYKIQSNNASAITIDSSGNITAPPGIYSAVVTATNGTCSAGARLDIKVFVEACSSINCGSGLMCCPACSNSGSNPNCKCTNLFTCRTPDSSGKCPDCLKVCPPEKNLQTDGTCK